MNYRNSIIRASRADAPALVGAQLAYIGIGSNLACAEMGLEEIVNKAFAALAELSELAIVVSSLWESQALDCPPGAPAFVNAVAALLPKQKAPLALLRELQAIEADFGRVRSGVRNAPRPLDLDLLSFGDHVIESAELILPHPRLHLRGFVLLPLLEVAPDYVLPGCKRRARDFLPATAAQGVRLLRNYA